MSFNKLTKYVTISLWFIVLGYTSIAGASANETPLQIDVYITAQPSVEDGVAQVFLPNGAVLIPLKSFGKDGTVAFDPKFNVQGDLKKEVDDAFAAANKSFKDADVKFVVRKIIIIRADQTDIKAFYDAENDVFKLDKGGKPSLTGAFGNATKGTTDAFRMLIAPISDDEAERGLSDNGGFVSVVSSARAFERLDNGAIIVHELTHNLGFSGHTDSGVMSSSLPKRPGTGRGKPFVPKLGSAEIGVINKAVSGGKFDAALTAEERKKRRKEVPKKKEPKTAKTKKDGKISTAQPTDQIAHLHRNNGTARTVSAAPGNIPTDALPPGQTGQPAGAGDYFMRPRPGSRFLTFDAGLCSSNSSIDVVGTQTTGGATNSAGASGNSNASGICGGVTVFTPPIARLWGEYFGLPAPGRPENGAPAIRTFARFTISDTALSRTLMFQRDAGTGMLDSTVVYRRGTTFSAAAGVEHGLYGFDCGALGRCMVGGGMFAGVKIFSESASSVFDQSGGGGGLTRQSSDRTTVQPVIGGSIIVTVPMDNPMVPFVDVVASASWSPAPNDFYFSGPDSFGQTISDRLTQDDEFALNLTVRVPISDGGLTASDARLKRDIRLVAALSEGINLYSYRYLGQRNRRVGVIAQEVVQVMPWAVQRHRSGFFMVDYSAVFADPSLQKALVGSGYELDL